MIRKKKNIFIIIILLCFVMVISLPLLIKTIAKINDKPSSDTSVVKVDTKLEILESNIKYADNAYSICLKTGTIITNVPISRIFINVNGVGTQDLAYEEKEVRYTSGAYVMSYTLNPVKSVCSTAFDDDATIKADIYVVYNDISYKANTSYVQVKSCWIGPY